jgi:hypothetical protein
MQNSVTSTIIAIFIGSNIIIGGNGNNAFDQSYPTITVLRNDSYRDGPSIFFAKYVKIAPIKFTSTPAIREVIADIQCNLFCILMHTENH